jgi:antitoxin MazE
MRARIVRIGNSHGIRLPKPLLEQVGVAPDSEVELEARAGRLVVTPLRRPREGWAEAFARANGEALLDAETRTRFDRYEWSW